MGRVSESPRSARAWTAACGAVMTLCSCAPADPPPPSAPEPVFRHDLLDNGAFAEPLVDTSGRSRLPWWRTSGPVSLHPDSTGRAFLELGAGASAAQPLAFHAPFASTLVVRGDVAQGTRIVLAGGDGRRFQMAPVLRGAVHGEFLLRMSDVPEPRPGPALELVFEPAPDQDGRRAGVAGVTAQVDLPCPSEAALKAELIAEIDAIFATWLERGADDLGPRRTAFLAKDFDARTGATLRTSVTGFTSFHQALFEAAMATGNARWTQSLAAFLEDFLTLQLHPATGLPRLYDPVLDAGVDGTPTEIALAFGFLIDVAERGPVAFRDRARAAAVKIGEQVLASGLLPDGNCAASYVPADGRANVNVSHLRRLDVPLQLVRLSALTGDPRFGKAAREPLATLEFTNFWHGTWDAIDPGFDDSFGHYGARAARAARALESAGEFRRFALEGWRHYQPIWRDALRFGGNVAADQVRCWEIGVDLAHVEPGLRTEMGKLLRLAARNHFRGEQYENGAWGDVTIFEFRPMGGGETGDLTGAPVNLLGGLASIYVDEIGLRTDEIRAMYTAVLRSTVQHYKREHGYLLTRGEQAGANSAYGSIRVLGGLVEMLTALCR